MIWHFHNAIEGITRKTVDQYARSRILSSYFSSFYLVGCGWTINRRRTRHPAEDLFSIREISMKLPDNAGIEPSISCPECREPVMKSKIEKPANDFFAGDAWKESGHRAVHSCQWFIGQHRGPAKVYSWGNDSTCHGNAPYSFSKYCRAVWSHENLERTALSHI
jgi:hypothetical protein